MMSNSWYRGEIANYNPNVHQATSGKTAPHDLGDGMYLADSEGAARTYALKRSGGNPAIERIYTVSIDPSSLRILDLTKDARWQEFIKPVEPILKLGTANENYGSTFNNYIQQYHINLKQYDAVIGYDYVQGGKQMCILDQGGKPSQFQVSIRNRVRPLNPAVVEELPPPPVPEVPIPRPSVGGGRLFLDRVKAGFKGLKSLLSAELIIGVATQVAAEVFLAYADKVAAETAIRQIQIFFLKEGFAKGIAAGVMGWTEDEVATEALNRVTAFRVQDMGDAAGRLTLPYMLKLAETCENYAVAVGYYWGSRMSLGWQNDMRAKGLAYLNRTGYDAGYWGSNEDVLYTYKFLATLAWALRRQTDPIVDAHIRFDN